MCALFLLLAAPAAAQATIPDAQLGTVGSVPTLEINAYGENDVITVDRTDATFTVTSTLGIEELDSDPSDGDCAELSTTTVTCTLVGTPATVAIDVDSGIGADHVTFDPDMSYTRSEMVGGPGSDTLTGGAGADLLDPQDASSAETDPTGEDVLAGGAGIDGVTYRNAAGAISVDLAGDKDDGPGGHDMVATDIENITGTPGDNDTLTGDEDDNVIDGGCCFSASPAGATETLTGNGGNDTLRGRRNQTMIGGEGNDTFVSGSLTSNGSPPDDDTITGGPGTDTVDYSNRGDFQPVTVNLAAGSNNGITQGTAGQSDENDVFTDDLENVRGGTEEDTLTGNGLANVISSDGDSNFNSDVVTCGGAADVVNANGDDLVDSASCETINGGQSGSVGSLSIADASLTEGNSGETLMSFTVTRTGGSGTTGFQFSTGGGSATPGSDYVVQTGVAASMTGATRTVTVPISGDAVDEPDESFVVTLSNPTGATIADGTATGTIIDDDPPPGPGPPVEDKTPPTIPTGNTDDLVSATASGGFAVAVGPFDEDVTGTVTLTSDPVAAGGASAARKKKRLKLGSKAFSAPAGKRVALKFKLSKKNRALLKRLRKIRVTAKVVASDASDNVATVPVKFTLKAPKQGKKRR